MTEGVLNESNLSEPRLVPPAPSIWRLVSRQARPIVPFNESGDGAAMYCVHPIAGDVGMFQGLAGALGPGQRFFGIQVPRSKMNAEFWMTIHDVARHHIEAVCQFQPTGPVILAGWSAGAIIALEMAQQLTAAGRDVPLLIALDGAPCNTGAGLRPWTPRYMWQLTCNVPGWLRREARESSSLGFFVRRMIRRANVRLQGAFPLIRTEQTLNTESGLWILEQHRSFIRGLLQAADSYVPKQYCGKVIVYESKVQPLDHLLQVGAVWRQIAPQAEIVRLDGNHESIFRSPDVEVLAEHLLTRLAELRSKLDALCSTAPLASAKSGSEIESADAIGSVRREVAVPIDHRIEVAPPAANHEVALVNVLADANSQPVALQRLTESITPEQRPMTFPAFDAW